MIWTQSMKCVFYLVNVAQPFADVFEALGVGDVVDQHDAHGSSVVGGGDGVEPFLARCVPTHTHKTQILFVCIHCFLVLIPTLIQNNRWFCKSEFQ